MGAKREFTFHEVVGIRERAAAGEAVADLAQGFGVTYEAMSRLVRGVTYADLPGPRTTPPLRKSGPKSKAEVAGAREKTKVLIDELRELRPLAAAETPPLMTFPEGGEMFPDLPR